MLPVKTLSTKETLSTFGKPISFKDIGRVTNGEMPRKPPSYFINHTNSFYAPQMEFPSLKQHIETILSQIEGLRYQWDEDYYVWRIEWGTRPIENGLDYTSVKIIRHGKLVAEISACEALNRFPHLLEYYENDGEFEIPNDQMRRWSKIELRVYWDAQQERVFLEFNRMTGCHNTFYSILDQFNITLV